jgi:hypothetical protein
MNPDVCWCGHVVDEHSGTGECQVSGCVCACYEQDEDDEEVPR